MKLLNLWLAALAVSFSCVPAQATEKPTYAELEQRIAQLEASKARTSEIANTALVVLQREMTKSEQLKHDIELSNRLVGKLNELVRQQDRAIKATDDLAKFLEAKLKTLLEIATTFEKELLLAKGENQAYRTFAQELRESAERNKKLLDRWSSITTRKQLPARNILGEDFLSMRWRFRTFNDDLFKALDMLDSSLAPEQNHPEPPERPKAQPDKITS